MTINNSTLEIQSTALKSWALGCIMACDLGKIITEFEQIRNHLHVFLAIRSAVPERN